MSNKIDEAIVYISLLILLIAFIATASLPLWGNIIFGILIIGVVVAAIRKVLS